MIKKTNLAILLLVGAAVSFLFVGHTDGINFAVGQETGTTDPGAETIEDFEKIEGNNTSVIENNTAISNPNNTVLDATDVNIEEN